MPISVYSEDRIFDLVVAFLARQPRLRNASFSEKAALGQLARAFAQFLASVLQSVKDADADSLPLVQYTNGVASTPASSQALDNWAFVFGLTSNRGAGIYGRNFAQAATGGTATATGTPGVIVSTGARLTDLAGKVTFQLRSGFTMGVGGSQSVVFDAVSTGSVGNQPAGVTLRWSAPPPGLATTLTLAGALTGGYDVESDIALALRLLTYLQNPPKGGTVSDWRAWTEAATDEQGRSLGIERGFVYPLAPGVGAVRIVALQAGSGAGRDPGATKQGQILAYLETKHIVTDSVEVLRPYLPSDQKLSIVVRIKPAHGYQWDWTSGGTGYTVASSTGTSLVLSSLCPTGLATAIDNSKQPQVQLTYSAQALPQVVRATAYVNDTPSAGQCTLTLDTSLTSTPAKLYPAGGAVMPVAIATLTYVDNVGPSTQSGYADPLDEWEAVVSVGRIAQAALDAVGTDGRRVLIYAPNVGADPSASVGVSIAVGAGSAATADVAMFDNVPGQGPQIPEVASVLVLEG